MADKEAEQESRKVPDDLGEVSETVDESFESLTAKENELHQKSVQHLLAKAITQFSSLEDLQIILKFGADANGCVERGMRPIHYAAYVNNLEAICLLFEHGCEINPKDDTGYTPVHLCAEKGHTSCLRFLIAHGASIHAGTDYVEKTNSEDSANKAENEDRQENDNEDRSLGATNYEAETTNQEVEVANLEGAVSEEGSNTIADADSTSNRTPEKVINDLTVEPLNLALENNQIEIVKILLENGANPNRRYFGGHEISLMPVKNIECLELLLDYGADPNVVDRRGLTPLMTAAKENENRAVRLLLSKGANINQQCPGRFEQKTALHIAVEARNRGIARTLCLQNATVSKLPNYKYNALHTAILSDRVDLVELILLFVTDIDELTDDNCTALMIACAASELINQKPIIHKLLTYGANPNSHSDIVNYSAPYLSPLVEYLDNQPLPDYEVVLKLIQYGATVHFSRRTAVVRMKDPFGILAYIPTVSRHPDIWNLLVNACSFFDSNALSICMHFSKEEKELYRLLGTQPLPLKHLVRLSIRQLLQRPIIEKILKLPLPVFLLKYLVFLIT